MSRRHNYMLQNLLERVMLSLPQGLLWDLQTLSAGLFHLLLWFLSKIS